MAIHRTRFSGILVLLVACAVMLSACGSGSEVADGTLPPVTSPSSSTQAPITTLPTLTTQPPATTSTTTSTTAPTTTTTTTLPPDIAPPLLVVTDPPANATVETKTYRFRGKTDPGCTVMAAGRYPADVDPLGNWSIVLVLDVGGNVATIESSDAAGNLTTVEHPVHYQPAVPRYYRFDDDGLEFVTKTSRTRLVDDPVMRAYDDHMGGVFYFDQPAGGPPAANWLPAGETEPWALDLHGTRFTGEYRGEPTLFSARPAGDCEARLLARNLLSGIETPTVCSGDALMVFSFGDGRFAGTVWTEAAGRRTVRVAFWDAEGREVREAHNPLPRACDRCVAHVLISPDGKRIAFWHRPDAWVFNSPNWDEDRAVWWARSKKIPAELEIIDLASGAMIRRSELPASETLTDFDGRYVVTTDHAGDPGAAAAPTESRIVDLRDGVTVRSDDGTIELDRPTLASPADIRPQLLWFVAEESHERNGAIVAVTAVDEGFAALVKTPTRYELWRSPDGVDWSRRISTDIPADVEVDRLAVVDDRFVAGAAGAETTVWTSRRGETWRRRLVPDPEWSWSKPVAIVAGPAGVLLHTIGGVSQTVEEQVSWSSDGKVFDTVIAVSNPSGHGSGGLLVAGDSDRYVALFQTRRGLGGRFVVDHSISLSAEGRAWVSLPGDPFRSIRDHDNWWVTDVAMTEGRMFVSVDTGRELEVYSSADGITWAEATPPQWRIRSPRSIDLAGGEAGLVMTGRFASRSAVWFTYDGSYWKSANAPYVVEKIHPSGMRVAVGIDRLIATARSDDADHVPAIWLGTPIGAR